MLDKIKSDAVGLRMKAMKAKDATAAVQSDALKLLISEATTDAKNDGNREVNDADIAKFLVKLRNSTRDTLKFIAELKSELTPEQIEQRAKTQIEFDLYQSYLPSNLSTDELKAIIQKLKDSEEGKAAKNIRGYINKYMQENYADRYDGKAMQSLI